MNFTNAATFGFSPRKGGEKNRKALQKALDKGGTVVVSQPGTYLIDNTLFIGSHTALRMGAGVILKKDEKAEPFTHVILNKGALTKTWDENITVEGLEIEVNGVDVRNFLVYGLHGQLAFFYVKDLKIIRYRCLDLGPAQYGVHICTFENILVDDVHIEGKKDGVHLGRGKGFTIKNGIFKTYDDAVALNGHDYSTGNPEMGWIENGLVENCTDLDADSTTGYFCRVLAGSWSKWQKNMKVQQSDTVISEGRLYRVQMQADGIEHISYTKPTHLKGSRELDGITWGVVQEDTQSQAGVRNVTFRDIYLQKGRVPFSIHFDNDKYSRSHYPGSEPPVQEKISFDNIRILHDYPVDLIRINTPLDILSLSRSFIRKNPIRFFSNSAMNEYGKTRIMVSSCHFSTFSKDNLIINEINKKEIDFTEGVNLWQDRDCQ